MPCFVSGCEWAISRGEDGEPILFKHRQFGNVKVCVIHGALLARALTPFIAVGKQHDPPLPLPPVCDGEMCCLTCRRVVLNSHTPGGNECLGRDRKGLREKWLPLG